MPHTGVAMVECCLPVTFDTYKGCGHKCKYCYTNFRAGGCHTSDSYIKAGESAKTLEKWCRGERGRRESWCDWDIPLCFGRNSDPFQPIEKEQKRSLAALKVFAKYGYPFIITTKGTIPAFDKEYLAVLKDCNVCWQQTMCSPKYDKLEPNAPRYEERLEAINILSNVVPRVIVRQQPMFLELFNSHIPELKRVRQAGAYAVLTETGHLLKPRGNCNTRAGRCYDYAEDTKAQYYIKLRQACHNSGLKFLCCDFKEYSDSLMCCGFGGMEGFEPLRCNCAWWLFSRKDFKVRPHMKDAGTGEVFQNLYGGRKKYSVLRDSSFYEMMMQFIQKTEASAERG